MLTTRCCERQSGRDVKDGDMFPERVKKSLVF